MGNKTPVQVGKKPGGDGVPAQSIERVVNGYVKFVPEGKHQTPIYGTPGLVVWASGITGAWRGSRVLKGIPWAVYGTTLYSFASDGTATGRGTIPGSDRVALAGDGTNVVVVAGGEIYVWNGSALAAVTDPDAPSASCVDWVDGYFLFGETDTDSYFIPALDDPTTYDALDFASAEWKPDKLVNIVVVRRTGHMLGERTIEAIQNVGTDFPFARYEDVFIDVGVIGREAAVTTNDSLYFLASDKTVRRLDGLTATPISDDAVKDIIDGWSDAALTVASAHVWENRLMISFWNPDGHIVYDQSTERWHERRSYDSETTLYCHIAQAYGLVLCFATTGGKIYKYSRTAYDEAGAVLPFEIVTPHVHANGNGFSLDDVEVIAQTGVGSLTLNPQLALEISPDGEEWGARQYRSLGLAGDRNAEVVFGPQGSFTSAALKLTITDAVQRAILGIFAEVDVDA